MSQYLSGKMVFDMFRSRLYFISSASLLELSVAVEKRVGYLLLSLYSVVPMHGRTVLVFINTEVTEVWTTGTQEFTGIIICKTNPQFMSLLEFKTGSWPSHNYNGCNCTI
jgi:hypothetical protein